MAILHHNIQITKATVSYPILRLRHLPGNTPIHFPIPRPLNIFLLRAVALRILHSILLPTTIPPPTFPLLPTVTSTTPPSPLWIPLPVPLRTPPPVSTTILSIPLQLLIRTLSLRPISQPPWVLIIIVLPLTPMPLLLPFPRLLPRRRSTPIPRRAGSMPPPLQAALLLPFRRTIPMPTSVSLLLNMTQCCRLLRVLLQLLPIPLPLRPLPVLLLLPPLRHPSLRVRLIRPHPLVLLLTLLLHPPLLHGLIIRLHPLTLPLPLLLSLLLLLFHHPFLRVRLIPPHQLPHLLTLLLPLMLLLDPRIYSLPPLPLSVHNQSHHPLPHRLHLQFHLGPRPLLIPLPAPLPLPLPLQFPK